MVVKKLTKKIHYGGSGRNSDRSLATKVITNSMSPEEKAIEKTIKETIKEINAKLSNKTQEWENASTNLQIIELDLNKIEKAIENDISKNTYTRSILMTPEEKDIEKPRNLNLSKKKQELENELQKLKDTIAITQFEIKLLQEEMEEANIVKDKLKMKKNRYAKWKSENNALRAKQTYKNTLKQMNEIETQINSPYFRVAKKYARNLLNLLDMSSRKHPTHRRSLLGRPLTGFPKKARFPNSQNNISSKRLFKQENPARPGAKAKFLAAQKYKRNSSRLHLLANQIVSNANHKYPPRRRTNSGEPIVG
jgi:hypothetical protein